MMHVNQMHHHFKKNTVTQRSWVKMNTTRQITALEETGFEKGGG